MEVMIPLVLTMLATGVVGGLIAGLLGVGGGIVIVPVLDTALAIRGVDPVIRMHVAVGTSLATIIFTSMSSARAHYAQGAVDMDLVKTVGPLHIRGFLNGVGGRCPGSGRGSRGYFRCGRAADCDSNAIAAGQLSAMEAGA